MSGSTQIDSVTVAGVVGKSTTDAMVQAILSASTVAVDAATTIVVVLSAGTGGERQLWEERLAVLTTDDVAVLTADDAGVALPASSAARLLTFGLSDSADFRADDIETTLNGTSFTLSLAGERHAVKLHLLGEHQATNALAALAVAHAVRIPIPDAIAALEAMPIAGRWTMEPFHRPDGTVVINDAISATPLSAAAALKTLALVTGFARRSVAVLGALDTGEEDSREAHDRIGRLVVRLNVKKLVVVGDDARHIHNAAGLEGSWDGESVLVGSGEEAYDLLREELRAGDVVLVKSSKDSGLGQLADRLAGADL